MNLVARSLEMVSGESFERMMMERLYWPLGCEDTDVFDTSFGTRTTAGDMAKVGQMLLNGGAYGGMRFFGLKERDEMLPVNMGEAWPALGERSDAYGLGVSWYRDVFEEGGEGDEKKLRFSRRMFGHGSATSSIFRVDLENGLVVTMARPGGGKDYNKHYQKFFQTIADYME